MWRFGPKNCTLILHKLRDKEEHENHANGFKISQVVLLRQIPLQGNRKMCPLHRKLFPSYVILRWLAWLI